MHIEWTHHLFSYWVDWFPFARNAPYQPDYLRLTRFPVQDYLASLDQRGINLGIVVQPEPYGQDQRLVLYALALEQRRLRATCLFLPQDPQAPGKMEQLVQAEPRFCAQRFHAFRGRDPYFGSWQDPQVGALWRRAGELGLAIELHISPEQANLVAPLLSAFPGYPVIIDHLAEPSFGSAAEYEQVLELARYPQVLMKLSALERIGREIGMSSLQSIVQRVLEAFGPARVVWGGGTLEELDNLLVGLTPAERAMVKGDNLAKLLGMEAMGD
ncbi:MAG: amidohydrolase family protein [Anaerolineae bacterium]